MASNIIVKGKIPFKNHHFKTTLAITNLGKNQQQMLGRKTVEK